MNSFLRRSLTKGSMSIVSRFGCLLMLKRSCATPAGHGDLLKQLRRCSASMVLNIGEGANRGHHKDKASRFVIARGE